MIIKKATKQMLPFAVAIWLGLFLVELPALFNPTPLSRAWDRVFIQGAFLSLVVASVQVFAKE